MAQSRPAAASIGQRLLWLLDRYRGDNGSLNEPMTWRLRGELDPEAMETAVSQLIARHEALRTTFSTEHGRLIQHIEPFDPTDLPVEETTAESAVMISLVEETTTRIDTDRGTIRVRLWQVSPTDHILCLNIHHLAMDRRSATIIATDLAALYNAARGRAESMAPVQWQYSHWADWQLDRLTGAKFDGLCERWTSHLDGAQAPPLPEPADSVVDDDRNDCVLTEEELAALHRVADRTGASLFAVTLALFFALVYGRTGLSDVAVASVVDGRDRAEVGGTVGFFEQMVILRGTLDPVEPITDLISRMQAEITLAKEDGVPLHLLPPDAGRLDGDGTEQRADDVVFSQIECLDRPIDFDGLEVEYVSVDAEREEERFGVRILFAEYPGSLVGMLSCNPTAVPPWVTAFDESFRCLSRALTEDPDATVTQLVAVLEPPPS